MKILFLTSVLLAIQVFVFEAFAEETRISTADNYQSIPTVYENIPGYEIVKDEHGYKAVLKNPDQESSQLSSANMRQTASGSVIGRTDLNNFVKLLIPESATDVRGVEFNYKYYYYDTYYNYRSYYKCVQYWYLNEAQTVTTIVAGEFDWSLADSYIVTVDTAHGIYKTEITQADLTSAITLSMDSTYLAPSLSVPFDLSAYDNYTLGFSVYDDQGKYITNYHIDKNDIARGYKIPSGHYAIQAFTEGNANAFSLLKFDYNLTPSTKIITFSSNDMAKVSFIPTEGNSTGTQLTVTHTTFLNDNSSVYSVAPSYSNNVPYIYVSKCNYRYVLIMANANNTSYYYGFTENEVDANVGPLTIKYDLNLKTQFIKPTNNIYGRSSLGSFNVINKKGQTVYYSNVQLNQPSEVIKLTRGSESYTFTFNNPSSTITLPNPSVSGTFTVDFSAPGPLAITPLKDSIFINRSNALADDAVLNCSVPFSMNEEQKDYIRITARNTGTNVWSAAGGYKLVAIGDSNPLTPTLSYPIPDGVTIKENEEYGFKIPITAPTRGIYTTDWRMMKGTTAFGSIASPEALVRSTHSPYTDKPLNISSLLPDKASPQPTSTKIRWTCKITGGTSPLYYFKIFKGSTLVKQSTAYTAANYFDWTPTAAGTDYRAQVYVKENGMANSTSLIKYSSYYTIVTPAPIVIKSLVPDKASPQLANTAIQWTCNITGGAKPVYYFRVYKGSTLLKNSPAYSATNYFDWTPTEAGPDYRVLVNVKEEGTANSTSVAMYSGYYTVAAPIVINSLTPDKASPQPTGTRIRWTCNATGGTKPVYFFKIFKGSTVVSSSITYTTTNYFDWTPTAAGTDYRALVYVREPGSASSTIVTKYSSYYTVTALIKSLSPDKPSPQLTNTPIRWTCSITGGSKPMYYFKIYKGSTLVKNSAAYSTTNYFDWTPAEAGNDYRALVYVKENGTANSTSVTKFSSYYTIAAPVPIVIKSLVPDRASPQLTNTEIRWTCNITGGLRPLYYFRVYKGTALVKYSAAYSAVNYFDWTPTEAGTDYRVLVNVNEDGWANSKSVSLYSGYYTITVTAPPTPIVIKSVAPDKSSPQQTNTAIRWTCSITGGAKPVYYFRVYKGTTLVKNSPAYSALNYFDWTPTEAGTDYRILVNVKEDGTANSASVAMYSAYYTVTAPAPKVIETPEPEDPGLGSININDIPLVKYVPAGITPNHS